MFLGFDFISVSRLFYKKISAFAAMLDIVSYAALF